MCRSFEICERDGLLQAMSRIAFSIDAAYFEESVPEDIHAGGTAYPGSYAPVIVAGEAPFVVTYQEADSGCTFPLEVRELTFGRSLEWKKGAAFNARLDSLLQQKAPWGDTLSRHRCVLPCTAFYESHRTEKVASPVTGKPIKRRYTFTSTDGSPLLLAAVYSGESFSVVTTEPNADVAAVHDRMPLVLTTIEARHWLDFATPLSDIAQLANRSSIHLRVQGEGEKLSTVTQPELPL